jgi:hypothetical protein
MAHDQFLQNLINDCIESVDDNEKDRFVGWESLFSILVYQGLLIMLPELKEWLKPAASAIALKPSINPWQNQCEWLCYSEWFGLQRSGLENSDGSY